MRNSKINNSQKIYSTYTSLVDSEIPVDSIIHQLIKFLNSNDIDKNLQLSTFLSDYYLEDGIDHIGIVELIGLLHQKRKESIKYSNTDERKHNGIYYTNYSIAKQIAEDTIELFGDSFAPLDKSFLEPCSGTGIFALAYLDTVIESENKLRKNLQKIINNMYFADIDRDAISLLKKIIPAYVKSKYNAKIRIPTKNVFVGDVLFKRTNNKIEKIELNKVFKQKKGFDIVLTNPPYKLLKANSNKYNGKNDSYKQDIKQLLNFIRGQNIYNFNKGTLNLYKLFLEEILENYTGKESKIGLLIPSTLLSDKQSFELRNRILSSYSISKIYSIPEDNEFFLDITQAFCFFSIDKGKTSQKIKLKTNIDRPSKLNRNHTVIKQNWIDSISSLKEIISTDSMGWQILSKIHKNNKLKEITSITNSRGELDLTLDKEYITDKNTNYPLLKGRGVSEYVFKQENVYVREDFVEQLNGKSRYVKSDRIVCQQISNMNSVKRLKFSKVPKNIILGNSCNFVTINKTLFSENNISMDYLLGLLNSLLLNWRFNITSSNNHIGNYELDELPVAIPTKKQQRTVEKITSSLVNNPNNIQKKVLLNKTIFEIYKLNSKEAKYILNKHQDYEIAKLTLKLL